MEKQRTRTRMGFSNENSVRNFRTNDIKMFASAECESFNGFSGTSEFEGFPMRHLFFNKHKVFASEWYATYFKRHDIVEYISKNEKKVVCTHYDSYKNIDKCVLYLGGKEHVYVYIYNSAYTFVDSSRDNKYAICLLFKKMGASVERVMDSFIKLKIPIIEKNEGFLNILVRSTYGYDLEKKEISKPEIDLDIHYNADLKDINDLIISKLNVDNSKGLVLLHGIPGTGKTTYIRHLINHFKKKVIYIPPSMADSLSDPDLIKFLISHSNSILVIEDAENVLTKRSSNSGQAVANILNLSDGLLSDVVNIQIIATFNTNVINIDEALLRKGRLVAKYEFKELSEDRSKKLSENLGISMKGKHTLSEIFNSKEESFIEERKKIGFNA